MCNAIGFFILDLFILDKFHQQESLVLLTSAKKGLLAKKLHISIPTVIKYLKQGTELGWCSYDPKRKLKQIICLTTKEIFNSITCGSKQYNIATTSISSCCKGKTKYAGRHPITNEKMVWEYK